MFKKIARIIKKVIITLLIITPIFIYMSIFDVDESSLENELSKHLNSNSLNVIYEDHLNGHKDKYLVAYFEIGSSSGISLLSKGINNKYQILDVYYTDDEIMCIDYVVEEEPYYILFGKSKNRIENLSIKTYTKNTLEEVNGKNIFIIKEGLFGRGIIKIHYDEATTSTGEEVIKLNGSINRKSKSRATIPLLASGFVIFVVGYTLIISSGGKYRISDSDVLYDEDQRVKQMKPW